MYSYCLFCVTSRCDAIADAIRRKLGYVAFSPRIVQRKWIKGECFEEKRPYLPGYVFVFSEQPITDFREIRTMEGVGRYLGDREDGYRLKGDDRSFAEMLYNNGGVLGIMKVYREGERVRLLRGNMLGSFEGEIIKLDRRRGRALLQYSFDGGSYKVWVGYELIDDGPQPRATAADSDA